MLVSNCNQSDKCNNQNCDYCTNNCDCSHTNDNDNHNSGNNCDCSHVNDNDNRITKKFVQKTRGYVSFVRGKNPLTFPLAIYPEDKLVKPNDFPINDKDGITISEDERIKDLKIIACPMNDLQKKVYEYVETDKSLALSILFSDQASKNQKIIDARTKLIKNTQCK